MATHTDTASVTYGALERILNKKILDLLCPVGKDLILSYDLGSDYATKLAAMFPGTTWSQKTTVNIADTISDDGIIQFQTAEHKATILIEGKETIGQDAACDARFHTISPTTTYHQYENLYYLSGLKLKGSKNLYTYHRVS